ncbi:MAG TPA: 1-deoxy-D-xylulose-5-phosphate synthase [Ruminococcaceae bacterium]|nr:1-deoxy-D-xylulose-5-phosphate synthase [Oscillospiraceae bacterium]
MDYPLLDQIKGPEDVKRLHTDEIPALCAELRQKVIQTVSSNGGHLASNLGAVELTVALHRVFSSPKDQIVWDVGHQSYVHKLLTGRMHEFASIRQLNGISGFPQIGESVHDPYGAGHSSTSISAAAGLAAAKRMRGEDGFAIAVVGDGALTGGLAFEGINNAGRAPENLIIVLNDNKMSISKNVGAIARYLMVIRSKPIYFKIKDIAEVILAHLPFFGKKIRTALVLSKNAVKNYLYHSTIFEEMGLIYLGPVDGHDTEAVERLLNRAKKVGRPALVHVLTVKGKGYPFAEQNPGAYHGVSRFHVETGTALVPVSHETFSAVFGRTLCLAASNNPNICAITAAMTSGTGLTDFSKQYKDRFFDVGIAEEHAVVFSAGLAANGMLPVFAVYSTFLQRAYDQIVHDVALQNLKVIFAIDRAGLVGEDGQTHQGILDVAFLNTIPKMTVYSPSTADELSNDLLAAFYEIDGPVAVRYPKGTTPALPKDYCPTYRHYDLYGSGQADILIVTYGRLFAEAVRAANRLRAEGLSVSVLKLNRIKPIDEVCFETAMFFSQIYFVEEGMRSGGVGELFCARMAERGFAGQFTVAAIEDRFVQHGSVKELLALLQLDAKGIAERVRRGNSKYPHRLHAEERLPI